jgi:23S rRNA pseudouridine2457 synthase
MILAFHKPFGILSQFTPDGSRNGTLAEFGFPPGVYPIGRLDADSEGLLLLSDEAGLNTRLLNPERGHLRRYWVQVERIPSRDMLNRLESGIILRGETTRRCRAWILDPQPAIQARNPPIRARKNVPDCWMGMELTEGKNRQVRRMTAAIGHPTLRLLRVAIGNLELGDLAPGSWRELGSPERDRVFSRTAR